MNWLELAPYIVLGGGGGVAALGVLARKFFVNWSKENVIVQGADTTAAMMQNFHNEIKRLAETNEQFALENHLLRRQISKLEAILEKLAVKFDIDRTFPVEGAFEFVQLCLSTRHGSNW